MSAAPKTLNVAPIMFRAARGSSTSNRPATTAPNTAVVPFRIEVRPMLILVYPPKISENGIALFKAPITK